jgi:TPR repeat protein
MEKKITFLLLLFMWLPAMAEEPAEPKKGYSLKRSVAAEQPKPKQKFTQEHLEQMKAAEEKYKDNPAVLNLISKLREGMGITGEPEEEKGPPPPPKHISTVPATRESAHEAYSKKDYETALEQYKALAAAGDPEATAIVGMMYEGGIGTDPDPVAAQAWYKRAAESDSEDNRFSRVVTGKTVEDYEQTRLSGDETAKANELREEIDREISEYGTANQTDIPADGKSAVGAKVISYTHYPAVPDTPDASRYTYMPEPRTVKFTPTKLEQPGYLRPQARTIPGHFQPEKFTRQAVTDDS